MKKNCYLFIALLIASCQSLFAVTRPTTVNISKTLQLGESLTINPWTDFHSQTFTGLLLAYGSNGENYFVDGKKNDTQAFDVTRKTYTGNSHPWSTSTNYPYSYLAVAHVYPQSLTIQGYETPIVEGNTLQLQAIPTPSNTTYNTYYWSSTNTSVANVNANGLVTAVSEGTAIIQCVLSYSDGTTQYFAPTGEQTATCTITVEENTEKAITFTDAEVKRICVENWDTNSDGELSYAEAAAVTDLGQVFRGNESISSFNELNYFTGLTSIGVSVFSSCTHLTSIEIPHGVTSIESGAFWECSSLVSVTIPNTVTYFADYVFYECSNLISLTIPNGVMNIYRHTFDGCTSLTSVTLPNSLVSIDDYAFFRCRNLSSLTIPSGVTSIGQYAFANCRGLSSLTIPKSLNTIYIHAFDNCSGLNTISVESGNMTFDSRENCNAVILTASNKIVLGCENTIIPNSVTAISSDAFYGCKGLSSMTIPNSITSIGSSAFQECSGIVSLIIPQNVTYIGDGAFSGCTNLNSVTVCKSAPLSIKKNVFSNRANATLYVPYGCKAAYEDADYWKEFKDIVELGTDISQLTDAIYIKPFKSGINGNRMMEVCLKNAQASTAYVFDMILPEGITVATDNNIQYRDVLGSRHDDHISAFNYKGGNTYSLAALSGNSVELTGNDDAVRLLTLHIADNLAEGTYAINVKNASYAKPDGTLVKLEDTTTYITLMNCNNGDANGDGDISVTDIAVIVNCILQLGNEQFFIISADANGDGEVTVTDIGVIVDIILGDGANSRKGDVLEPQ